MGRFGAGNLRAKRAGRPAEGGSRGADPDIRGHVTAEEERRGARTGDRDGWSQEAAGGDPSPALWGRLAKAKHRGKLKALYLWESGKERNMN